MAVRAETGAGPPRLLADAREALPAGPLHAELAGAWAEIDCGAPQAGTLARLGGEGGPELARLAVLIERSRRLGSPLAAGLQSRAAALRTEQGRALAEDAARAAPKIQLVVALMLVPSVLLLVGAAIAANAEALLSGLA
jgi:tight adherence protein C